MHFNKLVGHELSTPFISLSYYAIHNLIFTIWVDAVADFIVWLV